MNKKNKQKKEFKSKCCCQYCKNNIPIDIYTKFVIYGTKAFCMLKNHTVPHSSFCLEFKNKRENSWH